AFVRLFHSLRFSVFHVFADAPGKPGVLADMKQESGLSGPHSPVPIIGREAKSLKGSAAPDRGFQKLVGNSPAASLRGIEVEEGVRAGDVADADVGESAERSG